MEGVSGSNVTPRRLVMWTRFLPAARRDDRTARDPHLRSGAE